MILIMYYMLVLYLVSPPFTWFVGDFSVSQSQELSQWYCHFQNSKPGSLLWWQQVCSIAWVFLDMSWIKTLTRTASKSMTWMSSRKSTALWMWKRRKVTHSLWCNVLFICWLRGYFQEIYSHYNGLMMDSCWLLALPQVRKRIAYLRGIIVDRATHTINVRIGR